MHPNLGFILGLATAIVFTTGGVRIVCSSDVDGDDYIGCAVFGILLAGAAIAAYTVKF